MRPTPQMVVPDVPVPRSRGSSDSSSGSSGNTDEADIADIVSKIILISDTDFYTYKHIDPKGHLSTSFK